MLIHPQSVIVLKFEAIFKLFLGLFSVFFRVSHYSDLLFIFRWRRHLCLFTVSCDAPIPRGPSKCLCAPPPNFGFFNLYYSQANLPKFQPANSARILNLPEAAKSAQIFYLPQAANSAQIFNLACEAYSARFFNLPQAAKSAQIFNLS